MTMNLKNLYQNEYSFEETVNENFFKVDSFTHLSIFGEISSSSDEENTIAKELYLIVPPQPDANGTTTPDTLFQDKINQIACYHNNIGWLFYTPKIGDIAYIRNRNGFYYFTGAQWNIMTMGSSGGGSSTISPTPTGNTGGTSSSSVESISLNNPFSLGMIMRSKTPLNHPSWLKSDATLKSGAVYASMYFALLDTFNNGTDGTITIGGNTYNSKEKNGFVVIDSNDWQVIYSAYGVVAQFGIDTTNQQFYLPYIEERKVVEEGTNNYNGKYIVYSNGDYEETGHTDSSNSNIVFSKEQTDTDYALEVSSWGTSQNTHVASWSKNRTTTGAMIGWSTSSSGWSASGVDFVLFGKVLVNPTQQLYYDYYYVGDTIQSSTAINLDALITKLNILENRVQQLENA